MIDRLIADDHPICRRLRRIAQTTGITVVGEAASAGEVLQRGTETPTDVILLDVSMPGPSFIEVLQMVRKEHPSVKVLVLSVHPEDQWAGARPSCRRRGVSTKDHSPEQLIKPSQGVPGREST